MDKFVWIKKAGAQKSEILCTLPPFAIGQVVFRNADGRDVDAMLGRMAKGEITAVKIPGYRAFIMGAGRLKRARIGTDDTDLYVQTLREMGEWVKETMLDQNVKKFGYFMEGETKDTLSHKKEAYKERMHQERLERATAMAAEYSDDEDDRAAFVAGFMAVYEWREEQKNNQE